MNFLKQNNFFWEKARQHSLTGNEIAMYMYLLQTCNTTYWENPINIPNAVIKHTLGIKSFNTLDAIRKRLQAAGLLKYQTQNGIDVVEYTLYDVELKKFPTFSINEKVTEKVSEKVVERVDEEGIEEVIEKVDDSVLLYNKPKQKHKQKEREAPTQFKILEPEEIKWRLQNELDVQHFICRQYQFSADGYFAAAQLFVDEKTTGTNELQKPYPEIIKQFKAWVAYHSKRLQKKVPEKSNTSIVPVWRLPGFSSLM